MDTQRRIVLRFEGASGTQGMTTTGFEDGGSAFCVPILSSGAGEPCISRVFVAELPILRQDAHYCAVGLWDAEGPVDNEVRLSRSKVYAIANGCGIARSAAAALVMLALRATGVGPRQEGELRDDERSEPQEIGLYLDVEHSMQLGDVPVRSAFLMHDGFATSVTLPLIRQIAHDDEEDAAREERGEKAIYLPGTSCDDICKLLSWAREQRASVAMGVTAIRRQGARCIKTGHYSDLCVLSNRELDRLVDTRCRSFLTRIGAACHAVSLRG